MDRSNKPLNVRLRTDSKTAKLQTQKSKVKKISKKSEKESKNVKDPKTPKKKNKKIGWKIFRVFLIVGIAMAIVCAGIVLGVISGIIDDTESISLEDLELLAQTSFLYDMNGDELASLYDSENRIMVTYDDIPEQTVNAVVAIEDERFFSHHGIDIKRTLGAVASYVVNGGDSTYGGSTLTQQLVKNITSDKDYAWQRKIREWYRAISLETKLEKGQIFESYVNTIYYGDGCYGIEVASNHFFGKSVGELNIAESAAIASMIQSPEVTNPYKSEEAKQQLLNRKDVVLGKMLELNMISQEEYDEAKAYKIKFKVKNVDYNSTQSYFVDAVVEAVISDLMEQKNVSRGIAMKMIYTDGYSIYTTEDPDVQYAIDEAFKNPSIFYYDWDGGFMQGAMVVMDQKTGEVRGLIGGADEKSGALTLNRATQTRKQPGSCMKPFGAYGPAIEQGLLTPGSALEDTPLSVGGWSPHNWYGSYFGSVTVRQALLYSMNIPAARANMLVGDESYCWNFAYNCGLEGLDPVNDLGAASLGLGGVTRGFTVLEVCNAYATIANSGVRVKPRLYTKVVDRNGEVVLDNTKPEEKQAMKDSTAYMLTSCLVSVTTEVDSSLGISGTAVGAVKIKGGSIECAGKTGNTNNDYDRWFCGFTPYYTIACWTGYDENREIGRGYPYPSTMLFNTVMNAICADKDAARFSQPSSITKVEVCKDSGKVPTDACRADPRGNRVITDYVAVDSVSKETCTVHEFVKVCNATGKLASSTCGSTSSKSVLNKGTKDVAASEAAYVKPTEVCSGKHNSGSSGNVVIYRNGKPI